MNPARTLGPDIVSLDFTSWWIYIVGPVAGAAIAVMLIGLVRWAPGQEGARRGRRRCPASRALGTVVPDHGLLVARITLNG